MLVADALNGAAAPPLDNAKRKRPIMNREAFHGVAGRYVDIASSTTEADPVALLGHLLVMFGSAAGRAIHFEVEDAKHHLNEFMVFVGPTAKARKGTARRRVKRLLERIDPDWSNNRVLGGLTSGEGLIHQIRDPRFKGGDDGGPDDGVTDKRAVFIEEEFASVFKATARKDNTLSSILRLAYDSDTLRNSSKHFGETATNPHVSIIGHTVVDEAVSGLDSMAMANGLGNRICWLWVERSQLLPFGGDPNEGALNQVVADLRSALDEARRPKRLEFDLPARETWARIYYKLTADRPGLLGHLTARAEAHTLRFACLYATLDKSPVIKIEHLKAAAAFWDYCEQSVQFIWGDLLGDCDADAILRALRAQPKGLTRTEINDLFARNLSANRLEAALAKLLQYGKARCEKPPNLGKGRPPQLWIAITNNDKGVE
jgi:hypothetical protein